MLFAYNVFVLENAPNLLPILFSPYDLEVLVFVYLFNELLIFVLPLHH